MTLLLAGWAVALPAIALAVAAEIRRRRCARLVACALHEVRGPLTAARLAVTAAERGDPRRAGRPAGLRAVEQELVRAGDLLADLALAPAGRRRAELVGDVDVARLLRRAAAAWRPAARLAGRDVLVPAPGRGLVVRGDRGRLLQALTNLLANAVEHGGGLVVLGARVLDGRVRIEVADEGGGQADEGGGQADERRTPGRGLGLGIVADVARRHGGTLVREDGRYAIDLPLLPDGR